jgi:hypothetical protein
MTSADIPPPRWGRYFPIYRPLTYYEQQKSDVLKKVMIFYKKASGQMVITFL